MLFCFCPAGSCPPGTTYTPSSSCTAGLLPYTPFLQNMDFCLEFSCRQLAFKGHRHPIICLHSMAHIVLNSNLFCSFVISCRQLASRDHLHPIIFLHGVGAGLLPYIPFLLRTTALGRPLLAVEYKHLSMRWTDHIPTAPEVCYNTLLVAMYYLSAAGSGVQAFEHALDRPHPDSARGL